jgi:hypothetical protein
VATLRHPYSADKRRLSFRSRRDRSVYVSEIEFICSEQRVYVQWMYPGLRLGRLTRANIPAALLFPNSLCTQVRSICPRQHFQYFLVKLSLTCEERLPSSTQPWLFLACPHSASAPILPAGSTVSRPVGLRQRLGEKRPSSCLAVWLRRSGWPADGQSDNQNKSIRGSLRMTCDSRPAAPCPSEGLQAQGRRLPLPAGASRSAYWTPTASCRQSHYRRCISYARRTSD